MDALTPSDPYRLGRYWLAGRLGSGGQGVVYEAYGEAGERVAVKVPRADDPASRARLAKEAAAAQRVASFCTARIIEVRTDVARPYIVSEYVPGPNLRQVIAEEGPYRGDALRRLAIGAATALTAIHQAGVVHRDLKPDNIILGPDGPRVIDFGLARETGPTTTGPLMGTPAYMAPEVLAGRGATAAADVWAWGLVVLFAASGRDAVRGEDPAAVITAVLDFRPDTGGLAEPLAALVTAALSRDPADRPAARDLLLALLGEVEGDRLLDEGGSVAAPLAGTADPDLGTIAEALFEELSESERAAAPDVFLRMVGGDGTIRQVSREELAGTEAVDSLLALYGAAGLVTAEDSAYTLARPALIQAWPRLRQWVTDNREGLPVHRRLTEAARFWDDHGRKPGDLLHGSNLDRTLRWAAAERRDITLLDLERAFLDAAAGQSRRQSRRRGLLAAALAVLLVAALGALGLAEYRRGISDRQRDEATARSLALRAAGLRETDPRRSMLLSVAAYRLAPSLPETRGALYESLGQRTVGMFTDPDMSADTVYTASRDGRVLVSVRGGRVRLWDVREGRQTRTFSGVSPTAREAALSPDGTTLAIQDDDRVRLWDVATGGTVGEAFAPGASPGGIEQLRFDPGGRLLGVPDDEREGRLRWWDVESGTRVRMDAVNADGTLGIAFSTGSGKAELWDLTDNRRIAADWLPAKKLIGQAEFSGSTLAVSEFLPELGNFSLRFWWVPSGTALAADGTGAQRGAPGEVGQRFALGFGGKFVASWRDRHLLVLRLADQQVVLIQDFPDVVDDVHFDEEDRVIRLSTGTGEMRSVDVAFLFDRPVQPASADGVVRLSSDGRVLAVHADDELRLWDVPGGRPIGTPRTVPGTALAFSWDGRRVAAGGDRRVVVLDAVTGREISDITVANPKARLVSGLALSPDGTALAVASGESPEPWQTLPIELWNVDRPSVTRATVTGSEDMSYRPDGKLLVTEISPELRLAEPGSGTPVERPGGLGSLADGPYAFSPDGRLVAIGLHDRLLVWRADFTGPVGRPFTAVPASEAYVLAWSPDGRTIAAYESADRIRLWDVEDRRPLGVLFEGWGPENGFADSASLAFSADGRTLYSATPDGFVRGYPLDGERAAAAVCERVGRTLTAAEWRDDVPDREPIEVCGTQ
ncbi:serine/threonine-protein kinase [Planobispora rosea]|uniref:serine/threonine-protein kinase n=1 Tax=Planobispora rosea TaxID=35762 RepID=UPI0009FEFBCF|nr:serine/threonine-protein kinase [Planobispora rosea]